MNQTEVDFYIDRFVAALKRDASVITGDRKFMELSDLIDIIGFKP